MQNQPLPLRYYLRPNSHVPRPKVQRIDRTTGLPVILLNSIDSPDGSRNYPALLCWNTVYPRGIAAPPHLGPTEILRRSRYVTGIYTLRKKALFDDLTRILLDWEFTSWLQLETYRLARIWDQITPPRMFGSGPWSIEDHSKEHWIWHGALEGRTPVCRYGTSRRIPVMRLLWPTERPEDALFEFRDALMHALYPRPNSAVCTERMCVNPHHYEYAPAVRPGRDYTAIPNGNFARRGGLPPTSYHWTTSSPSIPDDTGVFAKLVLCPQGHPLGRAAQIKYNAALKGQGPASDKGYCPGCFKFRMRHGPQVPRRAYKGQPVDDNLIQTAREWFKDAPLYPGPAIPEPEPDPFEEFSVEKPEPGFNVHGPYDAGEIEDLFKDIGPDSPA